GGPNALDRRVPIRLEPLVLVSKDRDGDRRRRAPCVPYRHHRAKCQVHLLREILSLIDDEVSPMDPRYIRPACKALEQRLPHGRPVVVELASSDERRGMPASCLAPPVPDPRVHVSYAHILGNPIPLGGI